MLNEIKLIIATMASRETNFGNSNVARHSYSLRDDRKEDCLSHSFVPSVEIRAHAAGAIGGVLSTFADW